MCVFDKPRITEIDLDQELEYVRDEESLVRFECRNPNCQYATENSSKLFRHEEVCRTYTDIQCKQMAMHRPSDKIRNELIAEGIIPSDSWHNWHFVTFDVECFMDAEGPLGKNSIHRLVSIAVKASFGPQYYLERRDMNPFSVKSLMQEFVHTLWYLRGEMHKQIPKSVLNGHKKYEALVGSHGFRNRSVQQQTTARSKHRFLRNCLALRVYSWNGERYDHNVIWAPLLDVYDTTDETFKHFNIIRRGTGLMQFSDGDLIFRDFLNMTSPMSLDKFAQSCGVTSSEKTTFPYELYDNICDLRLAKEFPPYSSFRSSLRPNNNEDFKQELATLAIERVALGHWSSYDEANKVFGFDPPIRFTVKGTVHPDDAHHADQHLHSSPRKYYNSKEIFRTKCQTMSDYLKLYNLNDVILLEDCIRAYTTGFYDTWRVNIHDQMSLPSVAQDLAFRFYDEKATSIYTFGKSFMEFNTQIRKQLLGGMTLGLVYF